MNMRKTVCADEGEKHHDIVVDVVVERNGLWAKVNIHDNPYTRTRARMAEVVESAAFTMNFTPVRTDDPILAIVGSSSLMGYMRGKRGVSNNGWKGSIRIEQEKN
jgi:hypothetical protein